MFRSSLMGFLVVLMALCHEASVQTSSAPDQASRNPFLSHNRYYPDDPELRWVRRGTQLMIGGNWVFDPKSGRFMELPYATIKTLSDGGIQPFGISLTPLGERIVVWNRDIFGFGSILSPLSEPVPIPIPKVEELVNDNHRDYLRTVLFWIDEDRLVLYQIVDGQSSEGHCQLFDTRNHSWQPGVHCPEGEFTRIDGINPGPHNLITVYSSGEGVPGLTIARYDPFTGHQDLQHPNINLYPMGWAEVGFHSDGKSIDIVTQCLLTNPEKNCDDSGETPASWRIYSWVLGTNRFALRRRGLPTRSVPSPQGGMLAWSMKDRVCIAPIKHPHQRTCHCLPSSSQTCQSAR